MPSALPLTDRISQSSQMSTEYMVDEIQYNNGYSQRAKKGINNVVDTWSVSWDAITSAEFTTVKTAFDTAAGVDYFTWTPPGSVSSKKFKVSSISSMSPKSGNYYSISVTLKQVFDL